MFGPTTFDTPNNGYCGLILTLGTEAFDGKDLLTTNCKDQRPQIRAATEFCKALTAFQKEVELELDDASFCASLAGALRKLGSEAGGVEHLARAVS